MKVFRGYLAPQLTGITLDHSLFIPNPAHKLGHDRPVSKPPPTIDVTGNSQGPPTPKTEPGNSTVTLVSYILPRTYLCSDNHSGATHQTDSDVKDTPLPEQSEDEERDPPAIVIYVIDPFGFSSDNEDIHRFVMKNFGKEGKEV